MYTQKELSYNIYIVDKHDQAQGCICTNVPERRVERVIYSGLARIDRENFYVVEVETGGEKDLNYKSQLE